MTRSELEHITRAAGAIARDREILVFGSQAILGEYPDAPAAVLASRAADVFPLNHPERADNIESAMGELSQFHQQFGFYAQAVSDARLALPRGWRKRLVRIHNENTGGVTGLCLQVHDLAISKYVAGRGKDLLYTLALARHDMTEKEKLLARLAETRLTAALRKLVRGRIERDFS
jgi:uncharacterized nucleotidyltransferase DUF6036